eukprot:TRINITY_DN404_c0_g1_i3.p1 TRINITY_DN404_c0_g1~~TRINITY_DN404_c0_g1_i3.p1  ORF type:complete len:299 (-),score=17.91 TRINITY_DN404_c0_g1_i3:439-1308(-)
MFKKTKSRMEGEIINHKRLTGHPLIISFKEVFLTRSYLCIVMEYAEGGDMHSYVINCIDYKVPLNENEVRAWFQQLVMGVLFSHQMGIVNRDLKLENTLCALSKTQKELNGWWGQMSKYEPKVGELWHLKLCDFGYSKDIVNCSSPKSRVGTLPYAPPEVLYALPGQAYDGKKRDVWACGVILYTLLFGDYPFDPVKNNPDQLCLKIKRADYTYPPDVHVSRLAKDLIWKMLQSTPKIRCSIEDVICHPWFQINLPDNWNVDFSAFVLANQSELQSDEEIKELVAEVFQ